MLIGILLWLAAISLVVAALHVRKALVQGFALTAALAAFAVGAAALAIASLGCTHPPGAPPAIVVPYTAELQLCLDTSQTRDAYDACEREVDSRYRKDAGR
jgi:hypothetical protein